MAKTAEEILKNHIQGDEEKGMPAYMASMREFAAQEVEAYRQRIKDGIAEHFFKRTSLSFGEIETIIDAVK